MIHLDPITPNSDKNETYRLLEKQLKEILDSSLPTASNLANFIALIHHTFKFHWTGFYLTHAEKDTNLIYLDIFQGPVACTSIPKGKGVCGTCWEHQKTIIVPDVEEFPGHIACSSLTKSEIVVPIILQGEFIGVLDIDSVDKDNFDSEDQKGLERLVAILCDTALNPNI